uniref:Reverse transcriptase domain-containing protein n=1 Tax=Tanacetum cinerariifolium TaxID=118510 RepID=A0A6L2JLM6_TANCI|nr:hypothetical protein [Tanacetum cinerariifolium]
MQGYFKIPIDICRSSLMWFKTPLMNMIEFEGGKKSRQSNGDNTRGTTVGEATGASSGGIGQYVVLIIQNTSYCLEEQIHYLDCRDQYAVLSGKVDTSPAAASRGRGTGGRAGRGGGRTRGRSGDQGDDRINGQGGQAGGQGSENHVMVGAGHAAYTDRFHELDRLVPQLVTPEGKRIERNGSIKKNPEKTRNKGEPNKDKNVRDDNAKDCKRIERVVPRNVNPVESGSEARGNHQNQVLAVNEGQGRGNQGNQERGRVFMLGAEEARQDPNIMTDIEPNDLGFSYEIEITSRKLVEIDKIIKGCKLEIGGHVFDINLIPFGSESFDVIIGMDWVFDHKAEIICYEKVVRIPLLDGQCLEYWERNQKKI